MTTSIAPPRRWTYADYCRIPADGKRHEIIDGRHFVNPAPSPYHQTVSRRLQYELMRLVEKPGLGEVFNAPIDVHIGRGTLVQPDLLVLRPATRRIVGPKKLTGVPDLVIEILSPSTRQNDRRLKKARYERAGVREYWLVDPNAETIEQFVLRGKRYTAPALHTDSITLRILRGITIDLHEVW
ncbi:MAG: Uma2 family endonuclease [Planctomycetota bacterium]